MNEPALDPATRRALIDRRVALVRRLVDGRAAKEAVLSTRRNVAWLTVGADAHVEETTADAVAEIRILPSTWAVVTTVNEERRLRDEELADLDLAIEARAWEAERPVGRDPAVLRDDDLERQLRVMRTDLAPAEHDRMRWLGERAERALRAAAGWAKPGVTEAALATAIVAELWRDGVRAPVLLVAADDRMARYRHPLPTRRRAGISVLASLVAERWGLHVALSRTFTFGPPSAELVARFAAARDVEQSLHSATRPGRAIEDVLADGIAAYRRAGLPDEWRRHHQGGLIAYRTREVVATPNAAVPIASGMAFAWNPTVGGAKAEDTFVLLADGTREVVTRAGAWPVDTVGAPVILER